MRDAGRTLPLRALLAGLPDAALAFDGGGTVLGANDAAAALFPGCVGRHIALVARPPELFAAVHEVMAAGGARDFEFKLSSPHERTFAARAVAISEGAPERPGTILVVLRDVTEQERLSRMRADFVANASHELRTPLASLKGFVETLQGAARDDPKAREQFLAIMHDQASRMSRLIDDLLSLSRIEMREHVSPRGRTDLAAIVDDVCAAVRPVAEALDVRIETAKVGRPAPVVGDRDELAQVVHNLVHNAVKYGRRGGRVEIVVASEGGRMALTVADDGIGIAPEHLPRLTERFYRVNAKESRERGGTGLGLAIVKHIVSRHRGQLRIESQPGRGSTFSVILPTPAVP